MPDHPAASGRRCGNGQSDSNRCSGMKKGQATATSRISEVIANCNGRPPQYPAQDTSNARHRHAMIEAWSADMPDESRVATLKELLTANPDDAFARYALGLEYSGAGDTDAALAEFQRLVASHPDYTNGYF